MTRAAERQGSVDHPFSILLHPAFVPSALLLGLILRMAISTWLPLEQMSDSAWYVARAKELAAGLGYQEGGFPTAYWPIGWPAILAGGYLILDSMQLTIITLNCVSALIIMYLILWMGRNIAGSEIVGRAALLAYAIYPNHIAYTGNAASELAYTALALSAFILMVSGRNRFWMLLLSGVLFGIATLVKPQTVAFPIGVAIAIVIVFPSFTWSSALRMVCIIYISLFVVVSPWSYRNFVVFGQPVFVSTNGGTALLIGANDQMTGDHMDPRDAKVFADLGISWDDRVSRQVELNEAKKRAAMLWIKENTASFIAWMPKKVFLLWRKDTDGFWSYGFNYENNIVIIRFIQAVNQLYYLIIIALSLVCGLYAFFGLIRQHEEAARLSLLFCMPVFVSLLAAFFTGQIRYHFSAMPFLFVAAAWGLKAVIEAQPLRLRA